MAPSESEKAPDRLVRNAVIIFTAICLAVVLLFFTVPGAQAVLLVAYEQMYKAMITMAVMCGFVAGPV